MSLTLIYFGAFDGESITEEAPQEIENINT